MKRGKASFLNPCCISAEPQMEKLNCTSNPSGILPSGPGADHFLAERQGRPEPRPQSLLGRRDSNSSSGVRGPLQTALGEIIALAGWY